jgi:hypothetical protein
MKLIRVVLVLLLVAPALLADDARTYVRNYDSSTTLTYCSTTDFVAGLGRVATSGSSTTVTGTSTNFLSLVAGDEIFVTRPTSGNQTTTDRRVVQTTPTTATALTLTAVADWTAGFSWRYRKVTCGTGAENGWLAVGNTSTRDVSWAWTTINATSSTIQIECRNTDDSAGPAIIVWPTAANSASTDPCLSGVALDANDGTNCNLRIGGRYSQCRIGVKITTDTGVQDFSAFLKTSIVAVQ